MKITAQGRVTIPKYIRDQLDLQPGAEVEWDFVDESIILRKAQTAPPLRGRELVERMRGRGTVAIGTDAVLVLTRGPHP